MTTRQPGSVEHKPGRDGKETDRTLVLLRHAKSAWDDPSLDDHDRPLAPRGRRAARQMGRYLEGRGLLPDLVLCSTARRAQETLSRLAPMLPGTPRVDLVPELYLSGSQAVLEAIRGAPRTAASLLVIGHNPDIHAAAAKLATGAERTRLVSRNFPTAAVAIFEARSAGWSDFASRARLVEFTRPKDLVE